MTISQFNFLDNAQQLECIQKFAVPIVFRTEGDYEYRLLHIDTFYIEQIWQSSLNELLSYTPFNTEEKLLPYIHAIDLWQLKRLMHVTGLPN